jgi:hypothetical protein
VTAADLTREPPPAGRSRLASGLPWLVLLLVAAVSAIGVPAETVLARLFFVMVLVGGVVAALSVLGGRAQLAASLAVLGLVVVQMTAQRPIQDPPSSQWTVELRGPGQLIRHVIAPPLGSAGWDRAWAAASGAAAYVCARGPLEDRDGLDLYLNGQRLDRLTQEVAFGPRPQPSSVGFYRVPVPRTVVERQPRLVFELRRDPAAPATARPVEICGTFTYRPTAGLDSSAFFDGGTWTSPGPMQRGRYLIELRVERDPGRPLLALY